MRLPNAQWALVDDAKVADYLLSFDHPAWLTQEAR